MLNANVCFEMFKCSSIVTFFKNGWGAEHGRRPVAVLLKICNI